MRTERLPLLALLVGIVLCSALYYPGLSGDFIFDDWPNIVQNSRLQVAEVSVEALRQAAFSADSGTLKRPVSMLSFWANFYSTGLDPFWFKVTNLVIHIFNGVALFWLTKLLLGASVLRIGPSSPHRDWIALSASLIWLVHPINVTSVLYVVQRMTSLSATFVILGLVCYLIGRQRLVDKQGWGWPLFGLACCGLLATLSKENGVLLPFYMAVIELTLFRFEGIGRRPGQALVAFFLVTVAAPVAFVAAYALLSPDWIAAQYATRNFTLSDRLLTEARALWLYLGWLAAPTRAAFGLFHDDFPTSRGLLDPATTLLAVTALLAVCVGALRFRNKAPLFAFAVFWFIAGHVLESSIIALELVHEHRNYLPSFGPILAVTCCLWPRTYRIPALGRTALIGGFVLCIAIVTYSRALDWRDLHTLRMALVRDHPNSARSNYEAAVALGTIALATPSRTAALYEDTKRYLERAAQLDETAINPLFGMILLDANNDRPLDEQSIERLARRLSNVPLNTATEPFRQLVSWTSEGVVTVPDSVVLNLFESALDNPTADRRTRATLLSLLSAYYFNVANNRQEAISLAMAAVEQNPSEPAHHISLADLAIALGNFDIAAHELREVERTDSLRRFAAEAQRLAALLPEADSGHGADLPNKASH